MPTRKATQNQDPEKTIDLPPEGRRNADPITDTPGSHPIETGVGAALGGVASGAAVGAVGGPIGAVVGGIIGGAVAGGYAGKGLGELIDPTTEDNWLREYFGSEADKPEGATHETYRPAYRHGMQASERHSGKAFDDVESELRTDWDASGAGLPWDQARGAARHAYERSSDLRSSDNGGKAGA
jgi:hypothetical protein